MGIIKLISLDTGGSLLGLWNICEDLGELKTLPGYIGEWEETIGKYKAESRKKQFIASRLLLGEMTGYPGLGYTASGKPYLLNDQRTISISHAGSLAAILLSEKQTGIDLEEVTSKVDRIAARFLDEKELAFATSTLSRTICWCAKEALYKMDGNKKIIFARDMHIEPFEEADSGIIYGKLRNQSYTLHYELIDKFILVYVMN
jgi:4'-phosphopantetheinyl transferase